MVITANYRAFLEELAPLNEEQRMARLRDFFERLAHEDANRGPILAQLIEASGTVSQEARRKYLRSRTAVLTELPMSTQMAVMGTYREILLTIPREQSELEVAELNAIRPEMDSKYHQMLERFIHFRLIGRSDVMVRKTLFPMRVRTPDKGRAQELTWGTRTWWRIRLAT